MNKHIPNLYNTLLILSRNIFFYKNIKLKDTFETRVYLMFLHYSIILQILKLKKVKFNQNSYDKLFLTIENNIREMGYGDVAVNKKMKEMNKIFYDILLKFNNSKNSFELNNVLIFKYFDEFNNRDSQEYADFKQYFLKFYKFCFELSPDIMLEEAIKYKY